ncbi:MAG TPA: carbohydrate-binding domain-containing protein [Paludibacter sp.]|nr:carbohydrate-binding domain-containing protein [Paludibacter sp.]
MNKIFFLLSIIVIFITFASCDPENVIDNPNKVTDTLDYEWDSTKVVKISLNQTAITVSGKGATALGSTVTITKPGTYQFTGKLTDGQIIVNTIEDGRVRLILNNADVTNSTTSPLFVQNAERTILVLPKGTTNKFTDGANYTITADSLNAPIFSKDYLSIFGEGTLTVKGNYKGGITSKDELEIKSGNLNITSVSSGIRGKDLLKIYDGTFRVNCGGDAFKSDNDSSDTKGIIEIADGTYDVICSGDGFSATKTIDISGGQFNIETGGGSTQAIGLTSSKGIKGTRKVNISGGTFIINSSDNSIHSSSDVTIGGGTFNISTGNRSIKSDTTLTINGGEININQAFKGINGHKVTINNGKITVTSQNDCLKGSRGNDLTTDDGSHIQINGGTLLLTTAKGDAVDSNGSIKIMGGTLVVQGSQTITDDALTYRSTFIITGGNVIASGGRTLNPSTTSVQNTVLIKINSYLAPNTIINIQDEAGVSKLSYKVKKYALYVLVSSPLLETGKTYSIYTGGTNDGIESNGFYTSGNYTPGSKRGTFSITGKFTSLVY